jgi:multidrug efflux pump subunit AcrB
MEGVIHWFSRNHVAANFLMAIVLVVGIKTWFGLKKEIFPETGVDIISIQVPYPNAAPEEVATGVCLPIEEAIEDVDGIKRVTSSANESFGSVNAEVEAGFELRNVMDDIKTRVDAINNFAENTEKPVIQELLLRAQVLSVAVMAETDEKTLRNLAEQVRDELIGQEDITQVSLSGAREYEISIEVSEATLREYGLTFDQVANAVRASSLDLPSGSVRTDAGEILFRTAKKRYRAEEFRDVTVVTNPDGSRVRLADVAEIIDGFEDVYVETRLDGQPAILVNVFRIGNEDTRRVADAAKDVVDDIKTFLPAGVTLQIWNDTSVFLKGRMDLLARNGTFGLLLVFLVLALFLRPSLAALVSIGIPVSFAGAIMVMPWTGISINMISLFAFILVLGIVVDDAIVVGENVFRRMREGEHPRIAAPKGTHEVGVVVIFGVLTTAVAFTPMLTLSGVSGKIWPNIPLIVIPTLLFSLVQSKCILPAHLTMLPQVDPNAPVGRLTRIRRWFSHGLERFVDRIYRPVLRLCLESRYLVFIFFVCLLTICGAFVRSGWINFAFFPEVEGEIVSAKLSMARGVPPQMTQDAINHIEAQARTLQEKYGVIQHMLSSVGTQPFQTGFDAVGGLPTGDHLGEITLELTPAKDRDFTATKLITEWRQLTGSIPGTDELTFRSESESGGNAIDFEITGKNITELEEVSKKAKQALASYGWVTDIADNNRKGKKQLKLDNLTPQAEALNLRLIDVARQVRQGFYGEEVQRLQRGRHEVKVMVRYPRDERRSLANLEAMMIRLTDGTEVPFSQVGVANYSRGDASVQRSGGKRAIKISADIDKSNRKASASLVSKDLTNKVFPKIEEEHPNVSLGFLGEQQDQRDSVEDIMRGFAIALLVMYILMAIPLKSYLQPMIVMAVIPFGLVGAVGGHILMSTDLSIMSMCGIVALAGVVVNDSLVLVDYVNRQLAQGHSVIEAAWEAGAARFRPILLTSLTTFAGLTPMLLETDLQAKFLIPMAISLSFGILFATGITLILVPCIYLILEDTKRWLVRGLSKSNY